MREDAKSASCEILSMLDKFDVATGSEILEMVVTVREAPCFIPSPMRWDDNLVSLLRKTIDAYEIMKEKMSGPHSVTIIRK